MSEPKDIWYADDGRPMCRHGGRSHSLNLACPTDDCEVGERHPKWQRVEPGTVIPAGQPYRVEYDPSWSTKATAVEMLGNDVDWKISEIDSKTFVDSSWKPPLVLPSEPTWGIAVVKDGTLHGFRVLEQWNLAQHGTYLVSVSLGKRTVFHQENILDFIPLTDEQVARIEQAR